MILKELNLRLSNHPLENCRLIKMGGDGLTRNFYNSEDVKLLSCLIKKLKT